MLSKEPSLSINNIYKSFKRDKYSSQTLQVLRGFSYDTYPGQITGLVGENGCGKTTLFKIIMGIIKADYGNIVLNHHLIKKQYSKKSLLNISGSLCALLPEEHFFPTYTTGKDIIKEHLILDGNGKTQIKEKMEYVIEQFPLESFWHRPCNYYSRGQSMLLSLARLASLERQILLLDEPTNGLDYKNVDIIKKWIKTQAHMGKTVIICSHIMNDLKDMTDQIVLLENGQKSDKHIW